MGSEIKANLPTFAETGLRFAPPVTAETLNSFWRSLGSQRTHLTTTGFDSKLLDCLCLSIRNFWRNFSSFAECETRRDGEINKEDSQETEKCFITRQ